MPLFARTAEEVAQAVPLPAGSSAKRSLVEDVDGFVYAEHTSDSKRAKVAGETLLASPGVATQQSVEDSGGVLVRMTLVEKMQEGDFLYA